MTCWKTINISKEVGQNRLIMLSILTAILSFIVCYIPFSIAFQHVKLGEPPFFMFVAGLLLLPIMHKLLSVTPLIFSNKKIHFNWNVKHKYIVTLKMEMISTLSKKTSVISLLAPSIFITSPLFVLALYMPAYYPVWILMAAIHIGISLHDWIILFSLRNAPKKSIIEKSKNEFDILIPKHF